MIREHQRGSGWRWVASDQRQIFLVVRAEGHPSGVCCRVAHEFAFPFCSGCDVPHHETPTQDLMDVADVADFWVDRLGPEPDARRDGTPTK